MTITITNTFGEHPQRATLETCDHDYHDTDDIDDDDEADLHHRHHGGQDTVHGCYEECTCRIWSPSVHWVHDPIAQAEE